MQLASGDPINALVFAVKPLDVVRFSSLSKEFIMVVDFLNYCNLHVTTTMSC